MYSHLVLGGTFDHLHAGHKKLLSSAFSLSRRVLLGLTLPQMNEGKAWSSVIHPYEERKREIEAFVSSLGRLSDLEVIPIHDVYGTTLEDKTLEAILVTPRSRAGADRINQGRKQRGLNELPVHVCELLSDDSGKVLSSSRIRAGLVNRSGFVYSLLFHMTISVPETLKEYVRKPLGEVHLSFPVGWENVPLIFIGDIVTASAMEAKLAFSSAWIDGKSKRVTYPLTVKQPYQLVDTGFTNEPGTINARAVSFMEHNLISENQVFLVSGEEDLLTLPALLLAPLGSWVTYGNPFGQKGVTLVRVSEEKKEEIRSLSASI